MAIIAKSDLAQFGYWSKLGYLDIVSRYRRTVLGPLWISMVNGFTIFAIGVVYGSLFRLPLAEYFPFIVTGYIFWLWISSTVLEMSSALVSYRYIVHNIPVHPVSVLVRVFVRNTIVLMHNVPIILIVLLYFGVFPGWEIIWLMPGLFVASIFIFFGSGSIAFISARFHDFQLLTTAVVGVLFLVTPIIWSPDILVERAYIATFNPLTHIVEILRQPFLGAGPSELNYAVSLGLSVLAAAVFVLSLRISRYRYLFWI